MKTLDKITKEAYQLFSGNKPDKHLDACTFCCLTDNEATRLKSMPIKMISCELLQAYQDAAKPAKLSIDELKYFAPRYLELIKEHEYPSFEPLLSLTRFGFFQPSDWETVEYQLLTEFSICFFRDYINSEDHCGMANPMEILLMFYKGNFNLKNLLDVWENAKSIGSLLSFEELLDGIIYNKHGKPKVSDAFSDDTFSELICTWMFSDEIRNKFKTEIEQVILNSSGLEEAIIDDLSRVYDRLW